MNFFQQMGFIAYPLAIVGGFLLLETARAVRAVATANGEATSVVSARIHPVLVWGLLGAVVGVIGTVVGMAVAASFLETVDAAQPRLIWGGFKVALGSTIVGMLMLGFSSIAWLTLHFVNGRRTVTA